MNIGSGSDVREERTAVLRVLDALDQGLAIYAGPGALLHANPTFRTLADLDGGGSALWHEVEALVRSSRQAMDRADLAERTWAELETRRLTLSEGDFLLRGCYLSPGLFGASPAVLVILDRNRRTPLSTRELRERYGLTVQECRVARLLAEGGSNADIARRLHISAHTARTHVMRILAKLGVRSRGQVQGRLWT